MMVKICGITNEEDALAAAGAGASAVGFNFFRKSPRYIAPGAAARIGAALPASILRVGVFVNEAPEAVLEISAEAGMEIAQLHGGERPEGIRVWRACGVAADGAFTLPREGGHEALLLDTASKELAGGTGSSFPWKAARGVPGRVILAGGLDGDNVREAIREAAPWGVDACSRLERSAGRKDHSKMRWFVSAALSAS